MQTVKAKLKTYHPGASSSLAVGSESMCIMLLINVSSLCSCETLRESESKNIRKEIFGWEIFEVAHHLDCGMGYPRCFSLYCTIRIRIIKQSWLVWKTNSGCQKFLVAHAYNWLQHHQFSAISKDIQYTRVLSQVGFHPEFTWREAVCPGHILENGVHKTVRVKPKRQWRLGGEPGLDSAVCVLRKTTGSEQNHNERSHEGCNLSSHLTSNITPPGAGYTTTVFNISLAGL